MYERPSSRIFLSAALLLAGVAAIPVQSAMAACDPSSPSDGDTVTCSGTSSGVRDSGLDDAKIKVETGATVSGGASQGFLFKDNVDLTNDGSISSTGTHAVEGDDDATIVNNGSISSSTKDGIHLDENATITNTGTITAGDDGIQVGIGATIVNSGTITSSVGTDHHGIDADDDLTLTNTGTIDAGYDGVHGGDNADIKNSGTIKAVHDGINVNDNASVKNDGTITAGDDGIQVGANSTVVNNGSIDVDGEGVNADDTGISVTNTGTITSGDDGIKIGTDAVIRNSGTIEAGDDGIDIDSGTVINTGTIIAVRDLSSLDPGYGIDFDIQASGVTSYIYNWGYISGYKAIGTDAADEGSQIVYNYGTLVGTSGEAIDLGMGDDTLVIGRGSHIDGTIELGDGNDTFEVATPVASYLRFVSAPEIVKLNGTPAIVTDTAIATFDPAVFDAMDASTSLMFGNVVTALVDRDPGVRGWWATGFGSYAQYGDDSTYQGYDAFGGGVMLGHDQDVTASDTIGIFGGATRYRARLDDGWHDIDQYSAFAGLRAVHAYGGGLSLHGAAFGGVLGTKLDSPDWATGSGDETGGFVALTTGVAYEKADVFAGAGLKFGADLGWLHHWSGAMDVSGYDGATVASRSSDILFGALKLGMPMDFETDAGKHHLMPFVSISAAGRNGGDVSVAALGSSVDFSTPGKFEAVTYGIGSEISSDFGSVRLTGRIEAATTFDGDFTVSGGVRLSVPIGGM